MRVESVFSLTITFAMAGWMLSIGCELVATRCRPNFDVDGLAGDFQLAQNLLFQDPPDCWSAGCE
jgi:hypothetical protein